MLLTTGSYTPACYDYVMKGWGGGGGEEGRVSDIVVAISDGVNGITMKGGQ